MRGKFLAFITCLLITPVYAAFGSVIDSVNQLVVFGDSLSDNGNAAIVLGGTLPGNYAPNAFTDGPNTSPATAGPFGLWIDQFAAKAGLPDPQPYLANPLSNTNYAVASAQTGSANPQDIDNQIGAFTVAHPLGAPSQALYVVWGGANDVYNKTNTGTVAADNLYANILTLSSEGAKYFLWLNLPPIGDSPRGAAEDPTGFNNQSAAFNTEWGVDLGKLQAAGVDVTGIDINSLFSDIVANPGSYGLSNLTTPAQGQAGDPNANLFWDTEHPTTAGDAAIANFVYNDLTATPTAVPEPLNAALCLVGLFGVFAIGKLRSKAVNRG